MDQDILPDEPKSDEIVLGIPRRMSLEGIEPYKKKKKKEYLYIVLVFCHTAWFSKHTHQKKKI